MPGSHPKRLLPRSCRPLSGLIGLLACSGLRESLLGSSLVLRGLADCAGAIYDVLDEGVLIEVVVLVLRVRVSLGVEYVGDVLIEGTRASSMGVSTGLLMLLGGFCWTCLEAELLLARLVSDEVLLDTFGPLR